MADLGTHCIIELYGCSPHLLNDAALVKQALTDAVAQSGAALLKLSMHRFEPQGVTAIALLAESHMAIHTWPENGYLGADIFTCGRSVEPDKACLHLVRVFEPERYDLVELPRGSGAPLANQFTRAPAAAMHS